MFDTNSEVALSGLTAPAPEKLDLSRFKIDDLLHLRSRIDAALPAAKLSDIDLEHELVVQYQFVRQLQASVIANENVPVNQRAQLANACTATLDQLTKMQTAHYTAERFKAIENALIKMLRTLPEEQVNAFLVEYERVNG